MRIRLGGYQGPGSVHTRGLRDLAARLSAAEWDLEIVEDITASGRTSKALFEAAEREPAHLCYMASGYLTARVPSLAVLDLPLSVSDRLRAHEALDGPAGRMLAEDIAEKTDFHVLGFWDNGLRHISNRARPLRTTSDCSGLVIRTLDNELYQNTLAAFGFKPVFLDVRDLTEAVANGKVDAQENPLTNMLNFRLHEHHRFLSLTGHIFGIALLVCRASWFHSLPGDVSRILTSAALEATRAQRQWAIDEDRVALERLQAASVAVIEREALDMAAFQAAAAPLVAKASAQLDERLMEAYFGRARPLASSS